MVKCTKSIQSKSKKGEVNTMLQIKESIIYRFTEQAILNKQQEEGFKCFLVVSGGECKHGQGIVALQP